MFFAVVTVILVAAPGFDVVRESFFNLEAMKESFFGVPEEGLPGIGQAFLLNIRIFLVAEVLILILALVVAVIRSLQGPVFFPFRLIAIVYTDLFRGMPTAPRDLPVRVRAAGARHPRSVARSEVVYATAALVLSYSAYVAEVYRAGIESVHPSQVAAARSLGLSRLQSLRFVVLPQAIRRVIPPLLNDFVEPPEGHGAVAVLGVVEAARAAQIYSAYRFNYSSFVVAAFLFVLMTIPLARFTDWLIAA